MRVVLIFACYVFDCLFYLLVSYVYHVCLSVIFVSVMLIMVRVLCVLSCVCDMILDSCMSSFWCVLTGITILES